MNIHSRHVAIAIVLAIVLMLIATVAARAQDFSGYTGARLYSRFCASCHGDEGSSLEACTCALPAMRPVRRAGARRVARRP
jgi:hypothetical protein